MQTRAIKFRHRRIWHSSCPASREPPRQGGGPMLLRMVLWLCCISAGLAPQASRHHVEPRASRAEAATSGYSARTARSSRHESCCPEPGLAASRLLVRAHFAESASHIRRRGSPRTGSNVYEAPAKLRAQKMSRALPPRAPPRRRSGQESREDESSFGGHDGLQMATEGDLILSSMFEGHEKHTWVI